MRSTSTRRPDFRLLPLLGPQQVPKGAGVRLDHLAYSVDYSFENLITGCKSNRRLEETPRPLRARQAEIRMDQFVRNPYGSAVEEIVAFDPENP